MNFNFQAENHPKAGRETAETLTREAKNHPAIYWQAEKSSRALRGEKRHVGKKNRCDPGTYYTLLRTLHVCSAWLPRRKRAIIRAALVIIAKIAIIRAIPA